MPISAVMGLSFVLLALSICAVWLPPVRLSATASLPPWAILLILAAGCGVAAGNLSIAGLAGLGLYVVVAHLSARTGAPQIQKIGFGVLAALLALALAMHKMPGFHNPQVISAVKFSPDAAPYTHYLNFDKGAAGLVLLAFFCRRSAGSAEWMATLSRAVPVYVTTSVVVFLFGYALSYAKFDPKFPAETFVFLASNLFFVATAEEAFFRGFLQERLQLALGNNKGANWIAIGVSALLFGIAHFAGGPKYVLLAAFAGIGYAYAYSEIRRIEASIFVHVALNATHFFAFTYPYLGNQAAAS